jgi:hypothetical protein
MATSLNILGFKWTPKKRVRPWALAGPIIILLFCLPLLQPLRHPDPRDMSDDESVRLATVQAIVERRSLVIDNSQFRLSPAHTIAVGPDRYANQPATMSLLLSGAYWTMTKLGLSFKENGPTVIYLLTLLGVTIPVAACAGMIYRMGRVFELTRPYRMSLGLACVFGTGLFSYATVLNPHAPAAVLVLCAAASLIHVTRSLHPRRTSPWLMLAGFCAALAAAIDPTALIFLVLFLPAIGALRWPVRLRVAGVALYVIGLSAPLALHSALTVPVTGDLLPPPFHPELAIIPPAPAVAPPPPLPEDEIDTYTVSIWQRVGDEIGRCLMALIGEHGLLSHFPIVVLGVIGVGKIMHRHWPSSTKVLAAASVLGGAAIVVIFATIKTDWRDAMFATRWFIVFSPLLMFWAGAWLRKSHRPTSWSIFGVGLGFSVFVSLLGATGPWPRGGFEGWTVIGAMKNLISQDTTTHDAIAGRR